MIECFSLSTFCLIRRLSYVSLLVLGKYPHLLLSDSAKLSEDDKEITTVSFDSVGIQKSAQKYIYLHNKSTGMKYHTN